MKGHWLELAISKIELVILARKRIPSVIPIRLGDVVVQTRRSAKYYYYYYYYCYYYY